MGYEAEQQNRKNRALYQPLKIVKFDKVKRTAIIRSSKGSDYYSVTMDSCTCPDFQKRGEPCKHIYKLRNAINNNEQPKEVPPKVEVLLMDKPDLSYVVIGIIILIVAFFLSGASIPAGIVAALIGVYCFYGYFSYKRNPDNEKYITEEQLVRWQGLVNSDKKTAQELKKVSLPILIELKERVCIYYDHLSSSTTAASIEKWAELLLNTQSKVVDLSEFIIIKGDEPKKDIDRYWDIVEELRN